MAIILPPKSLLYNNDLAFTHNNFKGIDRTNWTTAITMSISTNVILVYGSIIHISTTSPTWGDVIATVDGYHGLRNIPVIMYSTRGRFFASSFVLSSNGELKYYGKSATDDLIYDHEELQFCTFLNPINH